MTTDTQVESAKQAALSLIAKMRDDATWGDIMDALYMRLRIARAEQEEAKGKLYTQAEVEAYVKKWVQ